MLPPCSDRHLFPANLLRYQEKNLPEYWEAPSPRNPSAPANIPRRSHMSVYYKSQFRELSESRVLRARLPLASVIGLRLQAAKKPSGKDSHLSTPHVMILELSSPVPSEGIAARKMNPQNSAQQQFSPVPDWTPGATASRATRHYIYGKAEELTELGLYLLEICPELKAMYTGPGNTLQPRG